MQSLTKSTDAAAATGWVVWLATHHEVINGWLQTILLLLTILVTILAGINHWIRWQNGVADRRRRSYLDNDVE
jgi:hypothetical protein